MIAKTGLAVFLGLAVAILGIPALAYAEDGLSRMGLQVISSTVGDFDCFGYGAPITRPANFMSPCGTLPGLPVASSDAPNTDVVLDCSQGTTISFTHTLDIPVGATILGGVAVVNIGGVEKASFPTVVTADLMPGLVPDTGAFGTGLVVVPLTGSYISQLSDGQVVVSIVHGNTRLGKCDPVFVDFSTVSVLVSVP